MKASPLVLIVLGVLILGLGVTGRTGVFLASIFNPTGVSENG